MKMQGRKGLLIYWLSACLIAVSTGYTWWQKVPTQVLNADEVAWILDSRFLDHYLNAAWDNFRPPVTFPTKGWDHPQFRLVDQPQFGKYSIGLVLIITGQTEWKSQPNLDRLAADFPKGNIPEAPLNTLETYLQPDFLRAIQVGRYFNMIIMTLLSLLVSGCIYLFTRSYIGALVVQWLLSANGLFEYIATHTLTSGLVYWLSIIALLCGLQGLFSMDGKNSAKWFWFSMFGIFSALATTTKLNASLLLLFPLVYLVLHFHIPTLQTTLLRVNCLVWLCFVWVFMLVEPETWFNPIHGAYTLYKSRFLQQNAFVASHGTMDVLEYVQRILWLLTDSQSLEVNLLFVLILMLGCRTFAISVCTSSSLKTLGIFLLIILVSNYYYARVVGFDTYLMPTLLICFFTMGIGVAELFKEGFARIMYLKRVDTK